MNKCNSVTHFALFSQFVTCLGRIVHHSPRQKFQVNVEKTFRVFLGFRSIRDFTIRACVHRSP